MQIFVRWAIVPLSLAMAAPAIAQDDTEIVVSAEMRKEQIDKASHEMARTLTEMSVGDQVPRWAMPVCTRVEGLDRELADRVRQTVFAIGKQAGVRMARGRCNPNVLVVFSKNPDGLSKELADRLPKPRNRDGVVERSAFVGSRGPLRWETRVSIHDARHGAQVNNSAALMNSGDWNKNIDLPTTDSTDATMIRKPTKAAIDGMMVVVDGKAAEGLELDQLSEYLAMVVLARPPMSATFDEHPSILNLGKHRPPGSNPLRLSEWDRAYLVALYDTPLDRSASAARSLIAQRMSRELAKN